MYQLNARKPSTLPRMVRVQSGELENLSIDSAAIENVDSKKSLEQMEQGEKKDAVMDSNENSVDSELKLKNKNNIDASNRFQPSSHIFNEDELKYDKTYNETDYSDLLEKYSLDESSYHSNNFSDTHKKYGISEEGDQNNNADDEESDTVETINDQQKGLIPLDYKFNNLSDWKPSSLNPKVKLLKFKLMQEITYREHLLDQLGRVVKNIDTRYWKYCAIRIRTAEENKSLNSELLVSLRNRIVVMQNEISALIAQVRSLSLDVIHSAKKLRYALRKDYQTENDLSIYFKGENYLLKVKHDLKDIFMCDVQPLQYWIAFEPNTFMIPPIMKPPQHPQLYSDNASNLPSIHHGMTLHNPMELWQREVLDDVFMRWFRAHCEKMAREMKLKKSLHNKRKLITVSKNLVTNITGIDLHQTCDKDKSPIREEAVSQLVVAPVDASNDKTTADVITEEKTFEDSLRDTRPKESVLASEEEDGVDDNNNISPEVNVIATSENEEEKLAEINIASAADFAKLAVAESALVSEEGDDTAAGIDKSIADAVAAMESNTDMPLEEEPEEGCADNDNAFISKSFSAEDNCDHVSDLLQTSNNPRDEKNILASLEEGGSKDRHKENPPVHMDNESLTESSSAAIETTASATASVTHLSHLEEWQALREYAYTSWGVDEKTGARGQGKKYAPEFWTNMDQNPFVVEAVICFQEVFPRMAIVPTVPIELQNKCLSAEKILLREEHDTERLKQRRAESISREKSFAEELSKLEERMSSIVQSSSSQFHSGLEGGGDGAIVMKSFREESVRLQLRQQGDSSLLSGISREYLLSNSSAAQLASTVLLLLPPIAHGSVDAENSMDGRSQAFLTDSFLHLPQREGSHVSADSFGTDAHYQDHFKQHLVDTSALTFFRIENSKAKKAMIEEKVADDRRMIEFLKDSSGVGSIPVVRQCNKGRRQLNRLSEQFMRFVAVTVQRVVRGFLGRRRFRKKWNSVKAFHAAVKIQKVVRGIIHRKMAGVYERRRNIETFLLRKALVHRHRAALLLTNCIRIAINRKRRKSNLPLLKLTPSHLDIQRRNKRKLLMKIRRASSSYSMSSSGTMSRGEGDQLLLSRRSNFFREQDVSKRAKSPTLADLEDDQSRASALSRAAMSDKSTISMDSNQRFELAMQREVGNVLTIHDEVERRKWQKQRAINLVQKVNEGKYIKDTVYTSRLIPMKEIKSLTSTKKVKLFSVKEHTFLNRSNLHNQIAAAQSSNLSTAMSSASSSLSLSNSNPNSSSLSGGLIPHSFEIYTGGPNRLRHHSSPLPPKKSLVAPPAIATTTTTTTTTFHEQKQKLGAQLLTSASSPSLSRPPETAESRRSAKIASILKNLKQQTQTQTQTQAQGAASPSSSFSPRDYKSNDSSPKLLVEDATHNHNSLLLNSITDFKSGTFADGNSTSEIGTGYLRKYFSRY